MSEFLKSSSGKLKSAFKYSIQKSFGIFKQPLMLFENTIFYEEHFFCIGISIRLCALLRTGKYCFQASVKFYNRSTTAKNTKKNLVVFTERLRKLEKKIPGNLHA